ncbi:MAG: helix-turn-helix domain-containing protein [Gammaproteobacteria bacterium]
MRKSRSHALGCSRPRAIILIGGRRHELGLTQRQVAEVLRVNRVTLRYWENHG